jgi:hypothetical protein
MLLRRVIMTTNAERALRRKRLSTQCAWRNLRVQARQCVDKWRTFDGFLADMGPRPKGLVLVARDPQKPWSKANCFWGPRYKACAYHSRARIITWNGISTSIGDWARRLKISPNTVVSRLYRGWDVERALTTQQTVKKLR